MQYEGKQAENCSYGGRAAERLGPSRDGFQVPHSRREVLVPARLSATASRALASARRAGAEPWDRWLRPPSHSALEPTPCIPYTAAIHPPTWHVEPTPCIPYTAAIHPPIWHVEPTPCIPHTAAIHTPTWHVEPTPCIPYTAAIHTPTWHVEPTPWPQCSLRRPDNSGPEQTSKVFPDTNRRTRCPHTDTSTLSGQRVALDDPVLRAEGEVICGQFLELDDHWNSVIKGSTVKTEITKRIGQRP
ncbi:hypothetical protein RRG08_058620 [Elysia crispata]|uniref:Uncharacterized protein n=1 Tax=Elysia crispata TaxID=231223 RepID=A0AAE1D7W9_9GAST|nr:hypothetical protein RRG08_058620 [Elysia crispata]